MSLAEIWANSPGQLRGKHIQQIISFAGDGRLRDDAKASTEFRDFLERIPLELLQGYAEGCLQDSFQDSFQDSGLALQDIVNEVGRRLDFDVEKGRYRGSKGRALLKLLGIKIKLEDPRVVQQIRSILTPQEFTRLDDIVNLVFQAAEDVAGSERQGAEEENAPSDDAGWKQVDFNDACVERIEKHFGRPLVKRSRVTWKSPDEVLGLLCKTSRVYRSGRRIGYWFGIHSTRYTLLQSVRQAWVAFGCGSPDAVVLVPYPKFLEWTDGLHITTKENGEFYWHVRIHETSRRFELRRKKGFSSIDLSRYVLKD